MKDFYTQRLKRGLVRRFNNLKVAAVARAMARREPVPSGAPVVFFKASTGHRRSLLEQRLSSAGFLGIAAERRPGGVFCLPGGHESLCAGDESR
jgi:hypothetical protein